MGYDNRKDSFIEVYHVSNEMSATIFPTLEELAAIVKKRTGNVKFFRIDEFQQGGRLGFQGGVLPGFDNSSDLPRMYYVKAERTQAEMLPQSVLMPHNTDFIDLRNEL